jgi:hypothetical protein
VLGRPGPSAETRRLRVRVLAALTLMPGMWILLFQRIERDRCGMMVVEMGIIDLIYNVLPISIHEYVVAFPYSFKIRLFLRENYPYNAQKGCDCIERLLQLLSMDDRYVEIWKHVNLALDHPRLPQKSMGPRRWSKI